jgi:hypothetical protein
MVFIIMGTKTKIIAIFLKYTLLSKLVKKIIMELYLIKIKTPN